MDHKLPTARAIEKRASLHTVVANVLGEEIISGQLPIGDLLPTEAELGARFNVSRTVIREAVKQLTSKGLLRTSSGIGTWVPPAHEWNFLDPVVFSWVKASGDSAAMIRTCSRSATPSSRPRRPKPPAPRHPNSWR